MVARGEVRWAEVGATSRPVVLLTRDAVIDRLSSIVVAPCTTTVRGIPSEVALGPEQGLPTPCVANLDHVTLVPVSAIRERITVLDATTMAGICEALRLALGCDR